MKRLRHYNQGTAIVLSCFGSVVEQQRYVKLQQHISELYPDCHVRMATSSKMVIKKLARKGEVCQSLPQVLSDLDTQGYHHILVVSCYLFPTDEHLYLTKIVDGFKQFSLSRIGQTPAIMHHSQLATKLLGALHQRFPVDQGCNLYIHHGAPLLDNPGHQAIHYCDSLLTKISKRNFTCSLEGAWPFGLLIDSLSEEMKQACQPLIANGEKPKLRLVPLLLVSGNHFENDLASIKGQLDADFEVQVAEPIQHATANSFETVNDKANEPLNDKANKKFCMLDVPELIEIIEKQIAEGLIKIGAPERALQIIGTAEVNHG